VEAGERSVRSSNRRDRRPVVDRHSERSRQPAYGSRGRCETSPIGIGISLTLRYSTSERSCRLLTKLESCAPCLRALFTPRILEFVSYPVYQLGRFAIGEAEVVFPIENCILLLLEGDTRRQRHQMPMDVTVGLLAAQAEDVESLRRDRSTDRFADFVDNSLQGYVLLRREVSGHLFSVASRRHKSITTDGWIFAQEGDRDVVFIDDRVCEFLVARNKPTDEASTRETASERIVVNRPSLWHLAGTYLAALPH
jgi:hypothetical protein